METTNNNNNAAAIKGIILDYGGTIDTDSRHWAEVLWESYEAHQAPCSKEAFREAYVYGERTLAKEPLVQPTHNFHHVLRIKTRLQTRHLLAAGLLPSLEEADRLATLVADDCHQTVLDTLCHTRAVVKQLHDNYPLVLVSNFYGNIHTILREYGLDTFFGDVIESSVVGVRKPDPAIFRLGVEALQLPAGNVVVVGDSYTKDIVPAHRTGCRTVWLKGAGWEPEEVETPVTDAIITSLCQLPEALKRIRQKDISSETNIIKHQQL